MPTQEINMTLRASITRGIMDSHVKCGVLQTHGLEHVVSS
jgi:hypothetical protein